MNSSSQRSEALRIEMLKQVQHDELLRFRNKHSLSLHGTCPEACPKMLLFGVSVQGSCLGSPVGLLLEPLLKVIPNSIPDLVLKTRQGSRSWPEARQHDVKRCHPPIPTYCHPAVFLCGSRSSHPSRPFDMNALLQTSVKIIPRILGK